jgi:hypothetical protein
MNKKLATIVFTIFPIIGACSNVSHFDLPRDPSGVPTVKSIIQQIRCELADLADPAYPHNETLQKHDFMVAIQLNITVNDDGSLAPTINYSNGAFAFNAGVKLQASREQNFTEKLIYSMRAIQEEIKMAREISAKTKRDINPFECPAVADTNLAGDLGLRESVHMALTSADLDFGKELSGVDGAFGGYVNFVVTKDLNAVGPNWTFTRFKGPGNLAGLSEVNTDKLVFAFAPRSPSKVYPSQAPGAKAEALLNQILINEISTHLSGVQGILR